MLGYSHDHAERNERLEPLCPMRAHTVTSRVNCRQLNPRGHQVTRRWLVLKKAVQFASISGRAL
jgi:hypothetical protein